MVCEARGMAFRGNGGKSRDPLIQEDGSGDLVK
jgi:hypothetical protein